MFRLNTCLILMTDAAMVMYPTLEEKIAMINNTIPVCQALEIEDPKAAAVCAVEVLNPSMNFMLKGLLPAIIAGIGINSISIETMISYFTPAALVIIVLAVLGAYIGAIIFGHLFGLWGYEAGITAGLCCCNIGGSGDLAVLTAGDRMSLLAFSSISTRIGGALMVVWIGFLYPMLMLK